MDLGRLGRFEVDFSHPNLLKRCVNCPANPPPCPVCASDEVCSQLTGDCNSCPVTMCTKVNGSPTNTPSKGPSPAGPIAGGVIGGIILICILTFLVWRFCIRNRRRAYDEQIWRQSTAEKPDESFQRRRSSMHSVRSIASTVITRASNVIQIAYIPGVTNRSPDSSPDLIPPVPPIPALAISSHGSDAHTPAHDEHFFMPSDLRNSTYSDYTVDRKSFARTSVTPSHGRGSVPSTAYRESAIVNTVPPQTAVRGKASAVAVRPNGKYSPSLDSRSGTPSGPFRGQQGPISANTTSPIVARLGVPKAVTVTKSNSNLHALTQSSGRPSPVSSARSGQTESTTSSRRPSAPSSRHDGRASTFDEGSSSEEESPTNQSLMGHEKLPRFSRLNVDTNVGTPSSIPDLRSAGASYGQSATSREHNLKQVHKRSGSLNQIIQEATRKAQRAPRHGGLGSVSNLDENQRRGQHEQGPFSDEHAAHTP